MVIYLFRIRLSGWWFWPVKGTGLLQDCSNLFSGHDWFPRSENVTVTGICQEKTLLKELILIIKDWNYQDKKFFHLKNIIFLHVDYCILCNSTQKHFPTTCLIDKETWNKQQVVMDRGKLWAKYKKILVGLEQQKKLRVQRNL